jgi:FixJ family two-component response regulator
MEHLVAVIDDDESVRESVPDLLKTYGFGAEAFASAEEFLASGRIDQMDCLILDVVMPGMSGPELLRELRERRHDIPVVFITAHDSNVDSGFLARLGATATLRKPFEAAPLLGAVKTALDLS